MQVHSQREGIDSSSYFLDAAFWRGLGAQYPDGVLVGVPQRGVIEPQHDLFGGRIAFGPILLE